MQLGLIQKPEQREFSDMTKPEKKSFLANDLIERMIHVEQKVRGSMGEGVVPYYQTNYFKELHPNEKSKFIAYLKSKKVKQKWKLFPWVLILGFGAFAGFNFTGNAIAQNGSVTLLDMGLIGIFIVTLLFYVFHIAHRKERARRLDRHVAVIDGILARRRLKR
jgi:hypothetical protein